MLLTPTPVSENKTAILARLETFRAIRNEHSLAGQYFGAASVSDEGLASRQLLHVLQSLLHKELNFLLFTKELVKKEDILIFKSVSDLQIFIKNDSTKGSIILVKNQDS